MKLYIGDVNIAQFYNIYRMLSVLWCADINDAIQVQITMIAYYKDGIRQNLNKLN